MKILKKYLTLILVPLFLVFFIYFAQKLLTNLIKPGYDRYTKLGCINCGLKQSKIKNTLISTIFTSKPKPKTIKKPTHKSALKTVVKPLPKPVLSGKKFFPKRFKTYYSNDQSLKKALSLLKAKKYKTAAKKLETRVFNNKGAKFWLVLSKINIGNSTKIISSINNLRKSFYTLKDYLVFLKAKVHLKNKDYENSLILGKILESGSYKEKGLIIQIETYKKLKKTSKEILTIQKFLKVKKFSRYYKMKYHLRLANLYKLLKKPKKTIIKHLLAPWYYTPGSSYSISANKLSKRWYKKHLKHLAGCENKVTRAKTLNRSNLNKKIIKTLNTFSDCNNRSKCVGYYLKGRSFFNLKKRRKAEKLLKKAVIYCEKTKLIEYRVKSKYLTGRSAFINRKYNTALAYFKRVSREHPNHSYSDDAIYKRILIYKKIKQDYKVHGLIRKIQKKYKKGDIINDAYWEIILKHLVKKDWLKTHKLLKKARKNMVPMDPIENWGRILYWLGVTAQKLGKTSESKKHFLELIVTAPLTYYSLLAINRLEESHSGVTKKILSRVLNKNLTDKTFKNMQSSYFNTKEFIRFIEFSRLGLFKLARKELKLTGLKFPSKKKKIKNKTFWRGVAYVFHKAELYKTSHYLMGRILKDHLFVYPAGEKRILWEIAYPSAYKTEVEQALKGSKVPPYILQGLIREESGFNPKILSFAGARGLAQIMFATAKDMARIQKIKLKNRSSLFNPKLNLSLAATYLKRLHRMFKGRLVMIVGSYNGGEGAMKRWFKKSKKPRLDLFVEMIKVKETRNYIKKVISSAYTYFTLQGNKGYIKLPLK
jgi:tetratricopeptide (TPR) repeat protein